LIAKAAAKDAKPKRNFRGLMKAVFLNATFAARLQKFSLCRFRKRRKAMIEKHFVQQITIDEQIAEVKREIAMRNKVYPKWTEAGSLSKAKADFQILVMEAVLISLQEIAKQKAPQAGLF
jgi:hypothetical protein